MDDTPKVRKQSLLNRTLNAADKASEVAKDLVDMAHETAKSVVCLLYTSPSPRDGLLSRMPSSA